MKALKPLRSTAAVIDVLGGNQQFQQDFDASPTTVSNWRNIGSPIGIFGESVASQSAQLIERHRAFGFARHQNETVNAGGL